jgi:hypothetical protein
MKENILINPSLEEVWEWRKQLRLTCEGMSQEERLGYFHQEAENALRDHGLKLVPIGNGQSRLERLTPN